MPTLAEMKVEKVTKAAMRDWVYEQERAAVLADEDLPLPLWNALRERLGLALIGDREAIVMRCHHLTEAAKQAEAVGGPEWFTARSRILEAERDLLDFDLGALEQHASSVDLAESFEFRPSDVED